MDQTQRAERRFDAPAVVSASVLSGRFLPQLLCDLYASWKRVSSARSICPKYNFKAGAPPSVSSARRFSAASAAFISTWLVTLGLQLLGAL